MESENNLQACGRCPDWRAPPLTRAPISPLAFPSGPMRSRLQSIVGLLLTVVLLAWSGVRTGGLLTQCAGDGHGPCQAGWIHAHVAPGSIPAAGSPSHSPAADQELLQNPGCGCPPGHVHLDAYPPLIGSTGLSLHPLILVPFTAYPISRAEWASPPRPVAAPITWEPVPPGRPPLHLASAPLLI